MKKSELKNLLNNRLNNEKSDLAEFHLLAKAVETNNWLINKRILKHLPEGCNFIIQYNNYSITFPSGNSHLIGWLTGSVETLTLEKLRHADSCYCNGSEERIQKIENILNDEKLFNLILKTHNDLEKAVKNITSIVKSYDDKKICAYHNPIYYDLLSLIAPDDKKRNAITEFRYN